MNTQLRESLLSELTTTYDYLMSFSDHDKRRFPIQMRYNLLRSLLVHFDKMDDQLDQLGKSNDILRKKLNAATALAKTIAHIMQWKYGGNEGYDFIESFKEDIL